MGNGGKLKDSCESQVRFSKVDPVKVLFSVNKSYRPFADGGSINFRK